MSEDPSDSDVAYMHCTPVLSPLLLYVTTVYNQQSWTIAAKESCEKKTHFGITFSPKNNYLNTTVNFFHLKFPCYHVKNSDGNF